MKLIKIGSSSSCDIVLHSEFVSSHHAEMILLDNGEIILEDKNSTNGTFVGNKRIAANKEVSVRRGDCIRFADTELQWAHVPVLENSGKYKAIINIGTNFRNDIVITGNYPSRFHATLKITKDGKAFLSDSGSKNGTKVNGIKLQQGKDVRIKRGDVVLCGDVDVTEQLKQYLPKPLPWLKMAVAAAIAVLVGLTAFLLLSRETCDICGVKGCDGHTAQDFRPAVVYVDAHYHYVIKFEDNPIPDLWDGTIAINLTDGGRDLGRYSATAFFIDREGRLATNRHVAIPWEEEYRNPAEVEFIKQQIEFLKEQFIPVRSTEDVTYISGLYVDDAETGKKNIGEWLVKSASSGTDLNLKISRLKKSKITVSGKMDYITVGYPGRYYTHTDELERCYVLAESGSGDKDIALLQMNDKKTPADIKLIFDVKNFETKKLEPLQDKLYTIGYPHGTSWALDDNTHSLEPVIRETMCSKMPSKYTFEFQGESIGGASGSPIFNQKGHLVGVLWGGWRDGATLGLACQAKYLKEMYEEEVGHE